MAAACHLSSLAGFGFIGPVVIYLTQRERSGFVARHALQALFLQLFAAAVTVLLVVASLGLVAATIGFTAVSRHASSDLAMIPILLWVLFLGGLSVPGLLYLIAMVLGTIECLQGREASLPIAGNLARSVHPGG